MAQLTAADLAGAVGKVEPTDSLSATASKTTHDPQARSSAAATPQLTIACATKQARQALRPQKLVRPQGAPAAGDADVQLEARSSH